MERDSKIYHFRRSFQSFAYQIISPSVLSKIYYFIVLRRKLNLNNPNTFNEKIQWLKLNYYPFNSLVIQCTDKFLARDYVDSKGYSEHLVPLLGVWNDANKIVWDELPQSFVLKCNHGCAYNIVVSDKNSLNTNQATLQLNKWLKEDFGSFNAEIHYSKIEKHLVLAEEYLGESLMDYKFFCFHGQPKFLYISRDLIHDRSAQMGFFNIDGSKIELIRNDYKELQIDSFPECFHEMIEAANSLSADFPFVRVDFFVIGDKWYFSELTFTPGAGMMPLSPIEYDYLWGDYIDLKRIN